MLNTIIIAVAAVLGLAAIIALFKMSYVKASPDQAFVITGPKKETRILIGKAGLKIPFIEKLDRLDLSLVSANVDTNGRVPNKEYINVSASCVATLQVNKDPEALKRAAINFLNMDSNQIAAMAREVLSASIRAIIGQMSLKEMVQDRIAFAAKVAENTAEDFEKMGLTLLTFNVQNFEAEGNVIENLGIDNIAQIQKSASIAKAHADRDVAKERAVAAQEANDVQASAQEAIAERNAQLETKQADLKKAVDTQKAQAEAAMDIEAENQRKLKDVAATNADIAKAEREAELKQKEIELREYELTALVRKEADAKKYATEKAAEADLEQAKRVAEARAYQMEQEAKALKIKAEAEKYAAEQKAAGIAAVGEAEAEALRKKAEAQNIMEEASVLEMFLAAWPEAVKNAAAPLQNVDGITLYGEGNSAKMVKDVMVTANQGLEAIEGATGVDLKQMLSSFIGAKGAIKSES